MFNICPCCFKSISEIEPKSSRDVIYTICDSCSKALHAIKKILLVDKTIVRGFKPPDEEPHQK